MRNQVKGHWVFVSLAKMRLAFISVFLLGAAPVWATNCVFNSSPYQLTTAVMNVPLSGVVSLPRDLSGSAPFYSPTVPTPFPAGTWTVMCASGANTAYTKAISMPYGVVPGMPNVYQTGVDGIGVRVTIGAFAVTSSLPITNGALYALYGDPAYGLIYDFVKTKPGPIIGGSIVYGASLPSVQLWFGDLLVATGSASGSFVIQASTCNVSSVTLDLGTHKVDEFSGPNAPISTAAKPFTIDISGCQDGFKRISVGLSPTTSDLGNGVVALSADSQAQGVGIQLLDGNGAPVVFNDNTLYKFAYQSGTGSWAGSTAFAARYFQTGASVVGGDAKTVLSFTMNYQ